MKATEPLRSDENCLARAAYDAVNDFFKVFEPLNEKAAAEGSKLLMKICKDAVALSLLMRTAKDEYRVEMLGSLLGNPVIECEKYAEDHASHPVFLEEDKPGTIAYFMIGALVKWSKGKGQSFVVLEKAQAVTYIQPGKKA